MKRRKYFQV